MKGLIVEDSKVMVQVLTKIIHTISFEENGKHDDIVHADNILLALNLISQKHFDYIFLDLNLRDDVKSQNRRDGLRVLEYVRENKGPLPVFIVTGDSNINTVKSVLQYKPTDYLVKPITKKTVKRCFEKIKMTKDILLTKSE